MQEKRSSAGYYGHCHQRLAEGLSNRSYLLDGRIVLRLKGKTKDPCNKNEAELAAIKALKDWPHTERVLAYDLRSGLKVSLYIKDTWKQHLPPTKEEMLRVARLLRSFHDLNIKSTHAFDPFRRLHVYKKAAEAMIEAKKEALIIIRAQRLYARYPLVFCHNDLVNGNILLDRSGDHLIDLEYAGLNIVIFDLASYLSENNIRDKNDIVFFLRSYGGTYPLKDIQTMMAFADLIWFYWAAWHFRMTKKKVYQTIMEEKRSFLERFLISD